MLPRVEHAPAFTPQNRLSQTLTSRTSLSVLAAINRALVTARAKESNAKAQITDTSAKMDLSTKLLKAVIAQQERASVAVLTPDYDKSVHSASRKNHQNAAVVIIGAGISGMCMAIDMIRKNKSRDFIILERGSQVGGTWSDNKYPGACCDVWSHLYSYSFEPNPNWSRQYPGQEEIYAYLVGVAEKWGLFKHIRFNTSVEEAVWSDKENKWKVNVSVSGEKSAQYGANYTITGDFLASGVGQLNTPQYPDIEGLDSFEGKMLHSARWDWSIDLEGKKIGIIGNGATAAQIIPEVSKVCENLVIFQRTPNWVVPRADEELGPIIRSMFKYVPGLRARYRAILMDVREDFFDTNMRKNTTENDHVRDWAISLLKKQIPNRPDLWAKLTPNYSPGCKRILMTDNLLPSLAQPQVFIETTPIQRITPNGIEVDGKEHELDILILATGFRATEFMYPIKIRGTDGRSLEDIWRGGAQAFRGVTVESLPNFGMLYGPNTNLGHTSIILMIEAQSRYISSMIEKVLKAKSVGKELKIQPRPDVVKAYNEMVQERMKDLTFSDSSCQSWYKTDDGLITNNWCGTVVEYQKRLSNIDWVGEYEVSGSGSDVVLKRGKENIGRVVEETVVPVIAITTYVTLAAALTFGYKAASKSPAVQKFVANLF
ncbi:hypothetical protein V492_02637 [Pseudogymnoascus sp. VKM F-4246]|nr:hypothetical protein V492_02637 [Pseudogymnoascus sp. VKM F-4246]